MHESLHDGITPRIVTTCGDLFNAGVVVHRRYEPAHEFGRIVAPESEWDSFDEDESREQRAELLTRFLACDLEEARDILLESQGQSRPGSRPWRDHGSRYHIFVEAAEVGLHPPRQIQG